MIFQKKIIQIYKNKFFVIEAKHNLEVRVGNLEKIFSNVQNWNKNIINRNIKILKKNKI